MNSNALPSASDEVEFDPAFVHSRREAIIIFCVWLAGLIWAVPYCYLNGYVDDYHPDKVDTIWGVPAWVFWGIGVPWLAADLFTTWFCFFYMKDDDLGEAHEGADIEEEIAELHTAQERKEAD